MWKRDISVSYISLLQQAGGAKWRSSLSPAVSLSYYEQKQQSSLQEDVKSICKKIKKIQSCDTILQYTMHTHSYPTGKATSLLTVKVRNTYSEQKKIASSFQYQRATHCNSQRHALRRDQMIYSMEIRKVFFFIGAMHSQLCRTLRNFFKRIGGGMVVDFSKIIL